MCFFSSTFPLFLSRPMKESLKPCVSLISVSCSSILRRNHEKGNSSSSRDGNQVDAKRQAEQNDANKEFSFLWERKQLLLMSSWILHNNNNISKGLANLKEGRNEGMNKWLRSRVVKCVLKRKEVGKRGGWLKEKKTKETLSLSLSKNEDGNRSVIKV